MSDLYTNMTPNNDETEIDLLEICGLLLGHILILLAAAILCGGLAYGYSKFFLPEEFQSSTTVYMLDRSNPESGSTTNSDLQASAALTKDYAQLITSRHVLEAVIERLGLPMEYGDLKRNVVVTTPNDGRIVTITVTDTDPAMAQRIANEIRIVGSDHIINVMEIDAVNIIDEANYPTQKSAPSNSRWALIGAMLGLILAAGIIVLKYLLDDTIKCQEDIDRYLDVSMLAMIPLDDNVGTGKNKGKKNKAGNKRS